MFHLLLYFDLHTPILCLIITKGKNLSNLKMHSYLQLMTVDIQEPTTTKGDLKQDIHIYFLFNAEEMHLDLRNNGKELI